MTTQILALEKDLFFSVKMRDTLRHHGMEVTIARNLATFEQRLAAQGDEKPALVIVNIAITGVNWEEAIREAREHGFPVLAFGSHMDLEARAKALQAGAQRVVANSKFTSDMPGLVQRMLSEPVTTAVDDEVEE
ncbi:MAG TPA: response regulator [Ktedonobacteraceae bacterium]|nr:response regulator [Ktedonobacteraceae bacterium]